MTPTLTEVELRYPFIGIMTVAKAISAEPLLTLQKNAKIVVHSY